MKTGYVIRRKKVYVSEYQAGSGIGEFSCDIVADIKDADKFCSYEQAQRIRKNIGSGVIEKVEVN